MQIPNTQRLNWQHGGAKIPTVLLVILLNVNVLGDQCAGQWRGCVDSRPRKQPFLWTGNKFTRPVHEIRHFHGRE